MSEPLILGIETSCDETGVGIVRGRTLLTNTVASSMAEHVRFGGVVPEVASRAHVQAFAPTLQAALDDAGVDLEDVDALCVTAGPGLSGALMVGVSAAKGLAAATGKPLYGLNHLAGHVAAATIDTGDSPGLELPTIALLVSGGHTEILKITDLVDGIELMGSTIDDAAGEAFDKTARLLGLDYPGGPNISKAAAGGFDDGTPGDPTAVKFPRGLSTAKDLRDPERRYSFSFSGLKTAALRAVEAERAKPEAERVRLADIAASFEEAIADVLVRKTLLACEDTGIDRILLGGGVAANSRLRERLRAECAERGITLLVPPLSLCTDNGAMMAALGAHVVARGTAPSSPDFGVTSSLEVDQVVV